MTDKPRIILQYLILAHSDLSSTYLNRETPCIQVAGGILLGINRKPFSVTANDIYIIKEKKSRSRCAVYFLLFPLLHQKLSF